METHRPLAGRVIVRGRVIRQSIGDAKTDSRSFPRPDAVTLSTTQGQILMNHQAFLNDESLQGQTNFFQVKYMLVGSSGARQSFSPRFIVYDSASASTGLAQPPSPGVVVEEEGEFRDIQQPLGSAKPPNDASPGDSRPTDTMPDSPIGSTGLTAGPSEGRVGGRGMPTGAIVGIAVGCSVIGLVVIGLLSWWFCLRRKRSPGPAMSELPGSEPHAVAGGHHRHHDALLAHKEVSTSAGMVETPDSPYLDERMHGHLGNGAAASTTLPSGISSHGMAPQQHSPYSPYADVAAPTAAASGSPHGSAAVPAASNMSGYQTDDSSHQRQPAAAAGSGTTAPLPISERYRHLAEEGMTPEQLAQLEAEERALDAAIAEAARR